MKSVKSRRKGSRSCGKQQDDQARRIREAIDGYATSLARFMGELYGRDTVRQAWREFTIGGSNEFVEGDPHSELFFAWLFHRWSPGLEKDDKIEIETLNGVQPTRAFLARNSSRLNPLLRRYLEACVVTPLRFYEILDCTSGIGFKARDAMTGVDLEVREDLASTTLKDKDIVFAHMVPIEDIAIVDAISSLSFPPKFKALLLQLREYRDLRKPPDLALRNLYFRFFKSYVPLQIPEM
jgi:hypothetical protein